MAYERTWEAFLTRGPQPEVSIPSSFFSLPRKHTGVGEGKSAPSLKQIRAALSFAYRPQFKEPVYCQDGSAAPQEPQIRYLLLADIRRLLACLKNRQQGYGSAFLSGRHSPSRLRAGLMSRSSSNGVQWRPKSMALRIKGKGSVSSTVCRLRAPRARGGAP